MELRVTSENDLVNRYVSVVGFIYGLNPRESAVATAFVVAYMNLSKVQSTQTEETPEEELITDVMVEVKSTEVLHGMVKFLGMPFTSFRNYVTKIKDKGFFVKGEINPDFLPKNSTTGVISILR